jgi:hypothetical protein
LFFAVFFFISRFLVFVAFFPTVFISHLFFSLITPKPNSMLRLFRYNTVQLLASRCASTSALREPQEVQSVTDQYIEREKQYGANNYKPLPVVINRGKGQFLMGLGWNW